MILKVQSCYLSCLSVAIFCVCVLMRLRWSSPVRWSCQKGALWERSTPGTRRRISSSGSVNGGLAGGIHPSFTTQKRKMVDLPHPGVPLTHPRPIVPCLFLSLFLSLPLFVRVVSCLVLPRKSWSDLSCQVFRPPFSISAPPDSCLLHSVSLNVLFSTHQCLVCENPLCFFLEWLAQFLCWTQNSFQKVNVKQCSCGTLMLHYVIFNRGNDVIFILPIKCWIHKQLNLFS